MDDVIEIDLRKIVNDLFAGWKWIVAITFLFGLAAFLFSFLQPRTYSAKALVVITLPRYLPNFYNQLQTINNTPPTNAAIFDLAMGDEIVHGLYKVWKDTGKANKTPDEFREDFLEAKLGSDPATVVLIVKALTPGEASTLANAWAQATVARANRLFSSTDENITADFQARIDSAGQSMQSIEKALSDFESRDRTAILKNELASLLAQQTDWLRKQRLIEATTRDAAGFIAQVEGLQADTPVPAAMQNNFMVLQLKVYNDLVSVAEKPETPISAGSEELQAVTALNAQSISSPLQVQLPDPSGLLPVSQADFTRQAQGWIDVLQAQSKDMDESIDQLSGQITTLQQQIQEQTNEKTRLELDYKNYQEIYAALVQKNEEVKVYSSDPYASTQVGSVAAAPDKSDSRNTIRNTAVALVVGFIVSVGFVLFYRWWRPY